MQVNAFLIYTWSVSGPRPPHPSQAPTWCIYRYFDISVTLRRETQLVGLHKWSPNQKISIGHECLQIIHVRCMQSQSKQSTTRLSSICFTSSTFCSLMESPRAYVCVANRRNMVSRRTISPRASALWPKMHWNNSHTAAMHNSMFCHFAAHALPSGPP